MTYPPQQPEPGEGSTPAGGYPPPPVGPPGPYQPPMPAEAPPGAYPPPGYSPPGAYPPPGSYPPPGYGPAANAPGYGPPGYPPPYGEYAPPRKRRRWPWYVGGAVLLVVVALVIVGVVFGRKGSSDPHTAVDRFWTAVVAHDRAKAETYVCNGKKLTSGIDQFINEVQSYQIGPESGSGNTRVYPVTVHLTLNGQVGEPVIDTTAKKSAGKWYVCNIAVH